jgi:hypothetical protein
VGNKGLVKGYGLDDKDHTVLGDCFEVEDVFTWMDTLLPIGSSRGFNYKRTPRNRT